MLLFFEDGGSISIGFYFVLDKVANYFIVILIIFFLFNPASGLVVACLLPRWEHDLLSIIEY